LTIGPLLLVLGAIAVLAPIVSPVWGLFTVGLALVVASGAEIVQLHRSGARTPAAYRTSIFTLVAGIVVSFESNFVFSGLVAVTAFVIGLDGVLTVARTVHRPPKAGLFWGLFNGLANVVLALVVWILRDEMGPLAFGLLMALRIASAGWATWFAPPPSEADELAPIHDQHPDRSLGLEPHPIIGILHRQAIEGAAVREPVEAYWSVMLLVTFFAIHIGRLDSEWTWLGMISPAVATAGDMLLSMVLTLVVLLPFERAWRWVTRPFERVVWRRLLDDETPVGELPLGERGARWWAENRMRRLVSRDLENNTLPGALRQAIRAGLPLTAVVIAVNPIWGFSWYFNSENWATGVWQKITEARTDVWRAAMIDGVVASAGAPSPTVPGLFDISPPAVPSAGDFSFLVVGDPGEGDPSQHALRDQLLSVARQDEVKFLVIASDVVYPNGEMRDYEAKFYLPFKGVSKPIYAIPGNHDWFNALDGFAANLLRPDSAQAALTSRASADLRFSSTTEARIVELIGEAARLRQYYGIQAGLQRAPFFELHTEQFSLVAVDTGILKSVDDREMAWLRAALDRSHGTFTMAILGHPVYSAGRYQAEEPSSFRAVHDLLKAHGVPVVIAGDTHDFEYYKEPGGADGRATHYLVDGGGGAYLSIGTALGFPRTPALADYAYYPRTDAMYTKLEAETPIWKRPVWWWVRRYGAWPFVAETLSAIFDFNRAPFFQSFIEVRVEPSANRVRILLYGVDGPLRWRELETGGALRPDEGAGDQPVEIVIPMNS
jgi:uncharacterized membrane protein HdeD (DUF308 family)/3',5'-cyclic AMP phosphodiesterase CpdA